MSARRKLKKAGKLPVSPIAAEQLRALIGSPSPAVTGEYPAPAPRATESPAILTTPKPVEIENSPEIHLSAI